MVSGYERSFNRRENPVNSLLASFAGETPLAPYDTSLYIPLSGSKSGMLVP